MKIFSIIKKIILWSYERGTWQYDVLCILILAFIFLTPSSCFHKQPAATALRVEQKDQSPSATPSQRKEAPEASKPSRKGKN